MTRMTLSDFEARYQADPDPWAYDTSPYERDKYAATLDACGRRRFASALELGASIGAFTGMLAPRCDRLTTLDGAPTAVHLARERLADSASVQGIDIRLGVIPADIPDGPFDLVVASEILYYLDAAELLATFERLRAVTVPGARVVAVHWRQPGPERPLTATEVHAALRCAEWLSVVRCGHTQRYLLDAGERQ